MIENDMRPHIVNWLLRNGYEDAHECQIGGWCDVAGFRFATRVGKPLPALLDVVAVELKMLDVATVISQAVGNQHHVNASYAAMPLDRCNRMRGATLDKFHNAGIGLLAVDGSNVSVLIPARGYSDGREQGYKKKWWQWHLKRIRKAKEVYP